MLAAVRAISKDKVQAVIRDTFLRIGREYVDGNACWRC